MKFTRLKKFVKIIGRGKSADYNDEGDLLCINQSCTSAGGIVNLEKAKKVNRFPYVARYFLKEGDVLINSTGGGTLGKVAYVKKEEQGTTFDTHVTLVRTKKNYNSKFLYYYLSQLYVKINAFLAKGSTNQVELQKDKTLNFEVPDMDKQKQDKAVNFLDKKIYLIDKKIALLEKKIELYEEYKKQIIYNTVTKGLDSNNQMKKVKFGWIKEIPIHWKISKIKSQVLASKGINASKYNQEYVKDELNQGEYPVYSGQTENDGLMASINSFEYNLKECLFVTTVGAKAMTHKKLEGKFTLSQNCALLELKNPKDNILDFYYYMLFPLFNSKLKLIPSHMQPSLTIEEFKTFEIVIPPKDEQEKIAIFLNKKIKNINKLIELTKKEIELQKEYKKTLINDVVTGKIEV